MFYRCLGKLNIWVVSKRRYTKLRHDNVDV